MLLITFYCRPTNNGNQPALPKEGDWHLGPEREELEPGYVYVRDKSGEFTFNRRGMDPREIARTEAILAAKYLKDIIERKDFALLIRRSYSMFDGVGSKMGGLNKEENFDEITNRWLTAYKKTKKDPYCNFDELFKGKISFIEISPYRTRKPHPYYSENYPTPKITYKPEYLFTINKANNSQDKILIEVNFNDKNDRKTYYIEKYFDHCPVPNLQKEDDPYIPEVDL